MGDGEDEVSGEGQVVRLLCFFGLHRWSVGRTVEVIKRGQLVEVVVFRLPTEVIRYFLDGPHEEGLKLRSRCERCGVDE
jgi:hypothetical protein